MGAMTIGVTARDGVIAVAAGLLMAASFPPLGLWPLAFVGVALFLWQLRDHEGEIALNLGLVFGVVYGLGTMYWLFSVFAVGDHAAEGCMLTIGLIALFGFYIGLLAILTGMTRGHSVLVRALLVGMFAAGIEWLRGDAWYLRFPWYTMPHALAQSAPWIAPVRWIGTYGLSFVIWMIAALGAFGRPWYWLAFLLLPACSLLLPSFDPPDHKALLLQTEEHADYGGGIEQLIPQFVKESDPSVQIDLAVCPEYSYQGSYLQGMRFATGPKALSKKLTCPVVFGATHSEAQTEDIAHDRPAKVGSTYENVAAVLDSRGELIGTFTKQRPVPMFNDGIAGTTRPVFPIEQGVLGIAICYDYDAPEVTGTLVRDGATVLIAPNFDEMKWGHVQHVNHELLFRLRAVENDRWVLRAASSGRSEAIDPHGVPSDEGLDIGEKGTVVVAYGHRNTQPLGSLAYLFGPAAAAGTLLFGTVGFIKKRRKGKQELEALTAPKPTEEKPPTQIAEEQKPPATDTSNVAPDASADHKPPDEQKPSDLAAPENGSPSTSP
jgi:apolipoprotein N-acyltransferase